MSYTRLEQQVLELIEPVAADLAFELIRIRISGSRRKTVQIMAERPDGGMSVDDCATLSRAISPVLDAVDPIVDEYTLEVSSPGVDRPLTRPKDFERYSGFEAKLELDRLVEGRKRFKGRLAGFEDGSVLMDLDGESETALFPIEWVASAKLVLTDELLKASAPQGAPSTGAEDADLSQSEQQRSN